MKRKSRITKRIMKVMLILLLLPAIFGLQSMAEGLSSQNDLTKTSPRHETIFANLNYFGRVTEVFAVNTFLMPDSEIVDYGSYVDLINLTGSAKPQIEGERIIFTVNGEDAIFRYQGTLKSSDLPWEFEIGYYLDGDSIEPKNLAGASGRLRIEVGVEQNPGAHRYFAENFMVQLNIPLAMDRATAIDAPAATKMYAGNTVTLAYTLLPGSAEIFYVEANVQDFTMGGINIAAMKAAAPLGDLLADLESGFAEMAEGTQGLIDGKKKLQEGMLDLDEGAGRLYGGLGEIESGSRELVKGMDDYDEGFSALTEGLSALGAGAGGLNKALSEMSAAMPQLSGGYGQVEDGLEDLLAGKEQLEQLASSLAQNPDPQVRMLAEAMLGQLAGLGQLQSGIKIANEGLAAHTGALNEIALRFDEFDSGFQESMDGALEIERGFSEIKKATRSLSEGVEEIKNGAGELKQNTAVLPEAVQKLIDGQKEMKDGVERAKNELTPYSDNGKQNDTVSFVAPEKADAKSVQFILSTPPIKPNEIPVVEIYEEQHNSVWQRFLDLFREFAHNFFEGDRSLSA